MKAIQATFGPPQDHWLGDGFPVRSLFSYNQMGAAQISPFLLLDYAGPAEFSPTQQPRSVGQHPHKGLETVTIVYQGPASTFTDINLNDGSDISLTVANNHNVMLVTLMVLVVC